jgi:hypothetical protein
MTKNIATAILCLYLMLATASAEEPWTLEQMIGMGAADQVVFRSKPVEKRFTNPWPAEEEAAFQERARRIIAAQSQRRVAAGNTYFENEKRTYGFLMAQVLGSRGLDAVRDLQREDVQANDWHRHTEGIDFYAAFTLKHQVRKYFYFGDLLEPEYRQRMFRGAQQWTQQDPLRRPHHAFKAMGNGWGPDAKNSWVDVRSTENLFLMRLTSVYLFAEETGNHLTAAKYKAAILNYAKTLYRVGIGEWDSENYHGHSIAPLCNLYDFAKDDEVKMAAKACLDFFAAAGALKYYRGGFNGPSKRDYNHAQPFGGSAANMLWVWFGDAPIDNSRWESDEVHVITSAYRPPMAVVDLARKKFARPVEIFASKPHYSATTSFDTASPPAYLETQHIGQTFLMGSLAGGTTPGKSDVNGFKVLVYDEQRGAVTLQGVPGPDPAFIGSPQYQPGKVAGENRIGQYGRLAIWLVKNGQAPWRWVLPRSVTVSHNAGVTFLRFDQTWLALRPLETSAIELNEAESRAIGEGDKARFPGHLVLAAQGTATAYCGVAIEVGDRRTHADIDSFERDVLAARVDVARLKDGVVRYDAKGGPSLELHWHDDPGRLVVYRDGHRHDWKEHAKYLYRSGIENGHRPIFSRWAEGALEVIAGDRRFRCAVDEAGKVSFVNE